MPQRDELDRLAKSVMDLIDTGHRRISRHLDLTRVRVLGLVQAQGPIRPQQIARALDMTASAVSRHLTALQQAGQVEVVADPTDARTFQAQVTAAGRQDTEVTVAAGTTVFRSAVADWSAEDVHAARVLIDRLLAAWERPPQAAEDSAQRQQPGPRWQRRTHSAPEGHREP